LNLSCQHLRLQRKRTRQRGSRRPRRPDQSRRLRHFGSPDSCQQHREGADPDQAADPDTRVPGEEGRYAAARAAAAAAPMPVSGDRPEAASTAAGAVGKIERPSVPTT
jgi:hypothetical protein